MTVTAISAAVSSFSGLQSLAAATGWPEALSPLFPLTVDAYAMTATRIWLSGSTGSERARRFARWNAIMAIGLSLIGNAVWHLIAAQVLTISWVIVVLVGAVPPAVLGLLSHLAVLRGQEEPVPVSPARPGEPEQLPPPAIPVPSATPAAEQPRPVEDDHQDAAKDESGPTGRPQAEAVPPNEEDRQLAAAQAADNAYRAAHGRPITRDELRKVLRVSTERATALLRELKEGTSTNR
ncbi:DUF2637 domain-containing protein [Micromonospora sp. Llam7]|uniref:DUF2637 domain-containing protein n=1 Tax=Micromonospora tarapacensis TaxID=2835305 RepID=UPI001C828885|nr:DUF2637 domain-containing protein [Micromonospora tarapacensis]MBX7268825.1 DUF2637 domain-containing protein [Micromonospora tarapacensis]